MKESIRTVGYIWYNPDLSLYQKGSKEDFDSFYDKSGRKEQFSLILKLTPISDLLAYRIVKELNDAHQSSEPVLLAV